MLKKMVMTVLVVGVMSTAGFAAALSDVALQYSPTELQVGVSTDVVLSLTGGPGTDEMTSAIILSFVPDDLAALGTTGFAWDQQADFSNPNNWFVDPTLPAPSAVSFGGALPVQDGATLPVATLTMSPSTLGTFALGHTDGLIIGDANAVPLPISGGNPTSFNVVPEPATFGLLAISALSLIRRRR
jgi:PEP-CTERM motif